MDKNVYKEFNKYSKNFIRELIKNFDHISEFKIMFGLYKILKTFNKKLPYKYFNLYIAIDFKSHIVTRDESFFMSDGFKPRAYTEFVDIIKREWVLLDNANKNALWDHLNLLIYLSDKCSEYRKQKKLPPIEAVDDSIKENDDECQV